MLNFLAAPKSLNTDHYERGRFVLTWNVNIFLAAVLVLLTFIFIYVESRYIVHYSIGSVLSVGSVFYLRRSGDYKLVAIALSFACYLLVASSLLFVKALHYIEPFWLMTITVYVFFVLGKRWGMVFLLMNIASMSTYFLLRSEWNLVGIEMIPTSKKLTMTMEYTASMMIIGYIVQQFVVVNRDAESRVKQANNEVLVEKRLVEKRNKEKTVLLQEIHHRVKNNLQVITSLLRMQSNMIQSEESRAHFQDSINRIMTMSLIHQKMYEKDDFEQISMIDYLNSLVNDLLIAGGKDGNVVFAISSNVEKLDTKTIVPLALILTELVSNTLKHAFDKDVTEAQIEIQLQENDQNDGFHLQYKDNGTWKERKEVHPSFGLELIETLTEQLEGTMQRVSDTNGTEYQFELKRLTEL